MFETYYLCTNEHICALIEENLIISIGNSIKTSNFAEILRKVAPSSVYEQTKFVLSILIDKKHV